MDTELRVSTQVNSEEENSPATSARIQLATFWSWIWRSTNKLSQLPLLYLHNNLPEFTHQHVFTNMIVLWPINVLVTCVNIFETDHFSSVQDGIYLVRNPHAHFTLFFFFPEVFPVLQMVSMSAWLAKALSHPFQSFCWLLSLCMSLTFRWPMMLCLQLLACRCL